MEQDWNGILLPKLFWPTVRKKCSSDWENFLKLEAKGQEFAQVLRSLEQFFFSQYARTILVTKYPFFSLIESLVFAFAAGQECCISCMGNK